MYDVWLNLINYFSSFVFYFMDALNDALSNGQYGINSSLHDINFNLLLFSETPIISFTLYQLIYLIIFTLLFGWFIKFIFRLLTFPVKVLQRYINRM